MSFYNYFISNHLITRVRSKAALDLFESMINFRTIKHAYESGVEFVRVRSSTSARREAYISSRECMSCAVKVECWGDGAGLSRASPSKTVCTGR